MKSTSPVVPGMNLQEIVFAKDQPQYGPVPAVMFEARVITRWKLSWKERFKLLFTGNLWLTLLTFGQPLQPILLEVDSPKRYLDTPDETLADA